MPSRAPVAQSPWRRFRRWLTHRRVKVHRLYGALLRPVVAELAEGRLTLVLDTLLWRKGWSWIQLGLVDRGRTVPLVGKVIRHRSSRVGFPNYRGWLRYAERVLPTGPEMVLWVERGFVHLDLLRGIKAQPRWHNRLRMKRSGVK